MNLADIGLVAKSYELNIALVIINIELKAFLGKDRCIHTRISRILRLHGYFSNDNGHFVKYNSSSFDLYNYIWGRLVHIVGNYTDSPKLTTLFEYISERSILEPFTDASWSTLLTEVASSCLRLDLDLTDSSFSSAKERNVWSRPDRELPPEDSDSG